MGDGVLAALYAVVLGAGWASAGAPGAPSARTTGIPWTTVVACLLVGVPSVLQLTVAPGLLPALERRPGELADGALWRLGTSLLVQDGGWGGTAFNLVALAVVGAAAERLWGRRRWWVVWLVAGVGAQFWGLVVQPLGAGNSVANFGLAASVAGAALVGGRGPARLLGVSCLLGGLVLLGARDIHGAAVVLGGGTGAVLALLRPSRSGAAAEGSRRAG